MRRIYPGKECPPPDVQAQLDQDKAASRKAEQLAREKIDRLGDLVADATGDKYFGDPRAAYMPRYPNAIDQEELDRRFSRVHIGEDRICRTDRVLEAIHLAAQVVVLETIGSREQSLAITALEEAYYWADKAIAIREA